MIGTRIGSVTDEYSRPVPGATIYVYNEDGTAAALVSPVAQPIVTDAFGTYTYQARRGLYREDIHYAGKLRYKEVTPVGLDGVYPEAPRDGMFFAFDADGDPVAASGTGADAGLRADLAANAGASLIGFLQAGTGAVKRTIEDKLRESVSVHDFIGPGYSDTADHTLAFERALATGEPLIEIPGRIYNVEDGDITAPVRFWGHGKDSIVKPRFSGGGGRLFDIQSDDVHFEDFVIDGTGTTEIQSGTSYGITAQHAATLNRISVERVGFKNFYYHDTATDDFTLKVAHPLYFSNVRKLSLDSNWFDRIRGAAIFLKFVHDFSIFRQDVKDARWYNLMLNRGCSNFAIAFNRFLHELATGVYWGTFIDLMSNFDGEPDPLPSDNLRNRDGIIAFNKMKGITAYGGGTRIASSENIHYCFNRSDLSAAGTMSTGGEVTHIRVLTRGISTSAQNGPCESIFVYGNYGKAGGPAQHLIYGSNEWQSARNPCRRIQAWGNTGKSVDANANFRTITQWHGLEGGFDGLVDENNSGSVWSAGTASVVGGARGFVASSAQGKIDGLQVGGGEVVNLTTPTASADAGLFIGQYVDRVTLSKAASFVGFWNRVRTALNSGPTLKYLDEVDGANDASTTHLFSVPISRSRLDQGISASAAYDPPSIASGASVSTDMTVTGAALGDFVQASFSADQAGITLNSYVRVANSNRNWLRNNTGAAVDLAAGTLYNRVTPRVAI
jgi:hypothetical protein